MTGIIPDFLTARENALTRVAGTASVTPDMHERKRLMFERSDAFVALPGGIGTLEELVEQLTWRTLGRHSKPVLLANIDGFWDPSLALLAHAGDGIHSPLTVGRYPEGRTGRRYPAAAGSAIARAPRAPGELAPEMARRL